MKYADCELKHNCEWKTVDWITNFYQLQICMEIFENSLLKLEGENEGWQLYVKLAAIAERFNLESVMEKRLYFDQFHPVFLQTIPVK